MWTFYFIYQIDFSSFNGNFNFMKSNQKIAAGILIPTMNRPDFLIRQLDYYASINCPYPIYIIDSSNKENFGKFKNHIARLNHKLTISHIFHPPGPDCMSFGLSTVKENYVAYSGDDDYQIPNCIEKCVDFLDKNPDYVMATGKAVSVRLKNSETYGEIERVADYPRPSINGLTGTQRVIEYFTKCFPTDFCIHRKNEFLESLKGEEELKDRSFGTELYRGVMSIVAGKTKTIDELGLIRQIHKNHYELPNIFDWITNDDWLDSYKKFLNKVSLATSLNDNISLKEAEKYIKKGFWLLVQAQINKEYMRTSPQKQKSTKNITLQGRLGKKFPRLKWFYKRTAQKLLKKPIPLHYAVLQPNSLYYSNFKPVMDSFAGKLR